MMAPVVAGDTAIPTTRYRSNLPEVISGRAATEQTVGTWPTTPTEHGAAETADKAAATASGPECSWIGINNQLQRGRESGTGGGSSENAWTAMFGT